MIISKQERNKKKNRSIQTSNFVNIVDDIYPVFIHKFRNFNIREDHNCEYK